MYIIIRTQTFILIINTFYKNIIINKYVLRGFFMTYGKIMNNNFTINIDKDFFLT